MFQETLAACRVLPVVTAVDVASTVRLAKALQLGGMRAIEITLRSDAALDAIVAVKAEVPGLLVAAGTVNTPADVERVVAAGGTLALSPGATDELLQAAADAPLDFVPGVATSSELMRAMTYGFEVFKLFPATALGGISMLTSLGGPFPSAKFCPTGGLNPKNFREFLGLSNVICCGGSWMVGSDLLENEDWQTIERLAREAVAV